MLIKGTAKWAKITGLPVWGYEEKHKEWSIDVYVDDETVERLSAEGLDKKLKNKGNGSYITFKRRETKMNGDMNSPIRIVDHHGNTLQDKDIPYKGPKIGNGSTVNVNFAINEYGKNEKSANILSLQIWDLVPYEGSEFPTKEEDESWVKEGAE